MNLYPSAFLLAVVSAGLLACPLFAQHPPFHDSFDDPESPGALTDGNPASTTAWAAADTAYVGAFLEGDAVASDFAGDATSQSVEEATSVAADGTSGTASQLDLDVGAGSYDVHGVKADFYTVRVPFSHKLSPRGTLLVTLPVAITSVQDAAFDSAGNLEDASIYGGGLTIGYAHRIYDKQDEVPYRWRVTPGAGVFLRDSSDLNMGAWVYNIGLSSTFAYQVAPGWVVNLGNSLSLAWNNGRKDYPDPFRDDQQVAINGVQVFRLLGRWTLHSYVTDTRFLRDALVDNFQTYAAGAGYKLTRTRSLRVSVIYEDGHGYRSLRGTIGTTWKF